MQRLQRPDPACLYSRCARAAAPVTAGHARARGRESAGASAACCPGRQAPGPCIHWVAPLVVMRLRAARAQVRYLQIPKRDRSYQPYRWVRYVTLSSSYVVRT
jgi:hypothetical protein